MERGPSVVDRFKAFAESSEEFFKVAIRRATNSTPRNPIETLKRLQREAFSDLMKLRDRQDKVERMLSFYKTSKGERFRDNATHVRGEVDVVGDIILLNNVNQQTIDAVREGGIRTGIHSKFIFQTIMRQKDVLVAELVSSQHEESPMEYFGSPLTLTKVAYLANLNDQFSVTAIPVGAQFKDMGINAESIQGGHLTSWPRSFDRIHDCAAGLSMKGSNFDMSLGGFLTQCNNAFRCMSMLGKVTYYLSDQIKLSVVNLHQVLTPQSQQIRLGPLTVPIHSLMFHHDHIDQSAETSYLPSTRSEMYYMSAASVALLLESEINDSFKINAWVEWQKALPRNFHQWSFSLSDKPEDELGWGFRVAGMKQGLLDHLQMEAFLNCNMGKRLTLQPGFVYSTHNESRLPAVVVKLSWSM